MRSQIIDWIRGFYDFSSKGGADAYESDLVWWTMGLLAALIGASFVVWLISRFILIQVMHAVAGKSKTEWDDHLMHNKVFKGLALLVPLMFMEYFLSIVFFNYPDVLNSLVKVSQVLIILAVMVIVNRVFNAIRDIMLDVESFKDKPIQSYAQILKILFSGILIIVMFSVLTGKSPIFFLTSLGALSAILLLIFRDTILGFVGSIQLAANDMIRIGDWITMERYGADGDVEEINLATVKVRNFDRTITTIPTYSFISDSFINWRGMEESDGRRIKRAMKIQVSSVRFASPELIQDLKKIALLEDFIATRQTEIQKYNEDHGFVGDKAINGRQQTNLGLFRKYIHYYLARKNEINNEMTLMVRQLEPTEYGVPLEIYCFSMSKEWAIYEGVVADIFDHLFAVLEMFELAAYERPTGKDLKESMNK
ncbi:MAG: mechanosensitive ion channel [Crocinitomicaceae bacterium]|nr:mechanosensitive ion channel [Crocinitomicaceae bacterium]